MADIPADGAKAPNKMSIKYILTSVALMLMLACAGFYATFSGVIPGISSKGESVPRPDALPAIGFVELDPILISLGPESRSRHFRFSGTLEVPAEYQAEVEMLKPRIVDVLNSYLRAVEVTQIEERGALIVMRAQMLRRIQMVAGDGRVLNLLVIEFLLS